MPLALLLFWCPLLYRENGIALSVAVTCECTGTLPGPGTELIYCFIYCAVPWWRAWGERALCSPHGAAGFALSLTDCWRQLLLHLLDFLYFFSFCFLVPCVRTSV